MKGIKAILAIFLISACLQFYQANAQSPELIKGLIQVKLDEYLKNPEMQLKFIQEFIKGVIIGEIRLLDLAINHSAQLGSEKSSLIKEEVNGLVNILFQGRYKTIQDLIQDIKKNDPKVLGELFSEKTFNKDIQQFNYQELLANAILNKLFVDQSTVQQKLTESFKDLDYIKKFLVKYRGANEEEIERAFQYMKDIEKLKKSLQFLINKLSDPKVAGALMKLALKLQEAQKSGNVNILSLIQDDKSLMNILADQDWEELLKIKEQITKTGGKVYEDYYKNGGNNINNKDSEDEEEEEEEEDEEKKSSMGIGKIFLIIFGVISLLVVVFLIYRKFKQNRYSDGTYSENKQLYRASV